MAEETGLSVTDPWSQILGEEGQKYQHFLTLMSDFKDERINLSTLIEGLNILLNKLPALVLLFDEYNIINRDENGQRQLKPLPQNREKAITLLKSIERRFQDGPLFSHCVKSSEPPGCHSDTMESFCHSDMVESFTGCSPDTFQKPDDPPSTSSNEEKEIRLKSQNGFHLDVKGKQKSAQPQMAEQTGLTMATKDLNLFTKILRETFREERWKCLQFLKLIKDFKAKSLSISTLTTRVKELFRGHPELLMGFNAFLPKGYEIPITDENGQLPEILCETSFCKSIKFINKVKRRFQVEKQVYESFLKTVNKLEQCKCDEESFAMLYKVSELFRDHPDLVEDFAQFVPDISQVPDAPPSTSSC